MTQSCNDRLVVFGGGGIEGSEDEGWSTKTALQEYFSDLTSYFDSIIWLALHYKNIGASRFTGQLDIRELDVVPLQRSKLAWPRHNWLARKFAQGSAFLAFMPNAVRLYPVFGSIEQKAERIGVYLANDFKSFAKESGYNRLPGGWRFYLHAHFRAMRMADLVLARGRKNAEIASSYTDVVHETVPMGHMKLDREHSDRIREHKEDGFRILYVGKVRWRKGMEELLRAFDALSEKRPSRSFRLDVVGDGPDQEEAQSYAANLEHADRVHFPGWIDSTERLEKYWARADVAVMPSSKHKEGVPRAIDEALNRRIPVVATAIGGIPQEYTDGEVYLVKPGDVDDLVDGLDKVLFNEELRQAQIERGEARIRQWREYESAGHQHGQILTSTDSTIHRKHT